MLSLTLCSPMDCSPPGSSIHGAFQARKTGAGCCCLLQGNLPNPGMNLRLIHWQADSYTTEPLGKPRDSPFLFVLLLTGLTILNTKPPAPEKQNQRVTTAIEEGLVSQELHLWLFSLSKKKPFRCTILDDKVDTQILFLPTNAVHFLFLKKRALKSNVLKWKKWH